MHLLLFIVLMVTQHHQSTEPYFKYRYEDSSVPPPYHRSYEIIVRPGKVKFAVDSYGDILFEEEITISNEQLILFENGLKKFKVKIVKEKLSEGCTGGTSNRFEGRFSNGTTIKGYEYQCGGKSYGTIQGNTEEIKKYFQQLVPDFAEKMKKLNN